MEKEKSPKSARKSAQTDSDQRRQKSKLVLREKILGAARALFVEHGYEAVSMRRIASDIGYTPTTIYLHFKDKDALCYALCDQDWLRFGRMFGKLLRIEDPVERLLRAGEAYMQFGFRYPQHYRWLFLTPRMQDDGGSDLVRKGDPTVDAYAFLKQTVVGCIDGGYFKAEYVDPDYVAQLTWAGVHGVVALHVVRFNSEWIPWHDSETLASGMVRMIISAFLQDPNSAQRSQTTVEETRKQSRRN